MTDNAPNTATSEMLAKMKAKQEAKTEALAPPLAPTPTPAIVPDPVPAEPEKVFQCYRSSRQSMKMITTEGLKVTFVNYQHLTADPRVEAYLDNEIRLGFKDIVKASPMTSSDIDPMAALKKKHIEEFLAEEAAKAAAAVLSGPRDMGQSEQGKLNPASTSMTLQAATSNSAASE